MPKSESAQGMKNNDIFNVLLTLPAWKYYISDLSPSKQR